MAITIPSKVIRKIIFDILIERSRGIDADGDEIAQKDKEAFGGVSDYAGELKWTACGTRALADDILEGTMQIEEAVEVLTLEERREAKARCQNWLNEKDKNDIEK